MSLDMEHECHVSRIRSEKAFKAEVSECVVCFIIPPLKRYRQEDHKFKTGLVNQVKPPYINTQP